MNACQVMRRHWHCHMKFNNTPTCSAGSRHHSHLHVSKEFDGRRQLVRKRVNLPNRIVEVGARAQRGGDTKMPVEGLAAQVPRPYGNPCKVDARGTVDNGIECEADVTLMILQTRRYCISDMVPSDSFT